MTRRAQFPVRKQPRATNAVPMLDQNMAHHTPFAPPRKDVGQQIDQRDTQSPQPEQAEKHRIGRVSGSLIHAGHDLDDSQEREGESHHKEHADADLQHLGIGHEESNQIRPERDDECCRRHQNERRNQHAVPSNPASSLRLGGPEILSHHGGGGLTQPHCRHQDDRDEGGSDAERADHGCSQSCQCPFKMVNPNAVPVWPIDAMLPMEAICRSCPQRGFKCEGRM